MKNLLKKWLLRTLFNDDILIFNIEQITHPEQLSRMGNHPLGMQNRLNDLAQKLLEQMKKEGAIVITHEKLPDPLAGERITMKVKVLL